VADVARVRCGLSSLRGRAVAEGAVRALMVVEVPPLLDDDLGFSGISEPLTVQSLVTPLAVEALDVAVLLWTARRDERMADVLVPEPAHDRGRRERRAVVAADVGRLAVELYPSEERQDDVLRSHPPTNFIGEAFIGVLVEHAEHLQSRPTDQPIEQEVIGPDRVGHRRPRRADVRAGATAPRPSARLLQAHIAPQATYAGPSQTDPDRSSAVTEPRVLLGHRHELLADCLVIGRLLES
jgi:hypothetical protein